MLCWKIWNESKALGCRPSELYDIEWPLARFYFDRSIYWWGNFIESKVNDAEATVRNQMKNRKGTDAFAASARISTFNKIFGLSTAAAYRQPELPGRIDQKPVEKANPKAGQHNSSMFSG